LLSPNFFAKLISRKTIFMTPEIILQYIFSGLTIGSIYAIVAIGYNIIYNTTGIINFAQGEFVMLGGMIAYSFSQIFPLYIAVILSVVITALIGVIIEFIFIRGVFVLRLFVTFIIVTFIIGVLIKINFGLSLLIAFSLSLAAVGLLYIFKKDFLKKENKNYSVLELIIITIGLSIFIRELALHIWDEKVRALSFFTGSEVTSVNILGAHISPQVFWVLGISAVIVIGLNIFFKFFIYGKAMRACASNKTAATLCGINIKNMVTLAFLLSAGIGALAGAVVSPLTQTSYKMGTELAIKGFTVAIFGGLGNSSGAVAAGLILGLLESFSISFLPMAYKDIIAIVILLLVLVFKPSGLFISKEKGELKEHQ
jgi:branched-chain amino acid transport system permease protein